MAAILAAATDGFGLPVEPLVVARPAISGHASGRLDGGVRDLSLTATTSFPDVPSPDVAPDRSCWAPPG
ncbi:hypothetical protein ACFWY5_53315 [Nonomuraea sp. NPDC059007]|uniref:hypothetical protein n=1 Tax=Nonomuraea sp. NPDC059007 TaxID=3346692 RepID=UPI0036815EA4